MCQGRPHTAHPTPREPITYSNRLTNYMKREPIRGYIRLMSQYNWQQNDWPDFTYGLREIEDRLYAFAEKVGLITGKWQAMPETDQQEALITVMVSEAVKTSAIEGEFLSRADVLSSIRNNLGLPGDTEHIKDKRAAGIASLMVDVRNTWHIPLTPEKLFDWHRMLFGDHVYLDVGQWRTHAEPMQVVSGTLGKEVIHYVAPPSAQVPGEMDAFLQWFNATVPENGKDIKNAPVRSAIAHLYFESIHPFEDGNGRIGRAVAEKALSQGAGRPILLSLSQAIESEKRAYYEALKQAQRNNEITAWITWFVDIVLKAQALAEELVDFTLQKVRYFDRYKDQLNDRQQKVINRMLEEGPDGFEGGLNARKYVGMTRVSKATATRDLQYLLEIGAIRKIADAGGRSTRYKVNLE